MWLLLQKDWRKEMLHFTILKKRNNILFRKKHTIKVSMSKQKLVSLNSKRRLYANLYLACQSREGNVDNFLIRKS